MRALLVPPSRSGSDESQEPQWSDSDAEAQVSPPAGTDNEPVQRRFSADVGDPSPSVPPLDLSRRSASTGNAMGAVTSSISYEPRSRSSSLAKSDGGQRAGREEHCRPKGTPRSRRSASCVRSSLRKACKELSPTVAALALDPPTPRDSESSAGQSSRREREGTVPQSSRESRARSFLKCATSSGVPSRRHSFLSFDGLAETITIRVERRASAPAAVDRHTFHSLTRSGVLPDDAAATAIRRETTNTLIAAPADVAARQLSSRQSARLAMSGRRNGMPLSGRCLTPKALLQAADARHTKDERLFFVPEGGKPLLVAGFPEALLEYATREGAIDHEDYDSILLLHRRYFPSEKVLSVLSAPLLQASPGESRKAAASRFSRLVTFWMRNYPQHFHRSGELFPAFITCLQESVAPVCSSTAEELLQLLTLTMQKLEARQMEVEVSPAVAFAAAAAAAADGHGDELLDIPFKDLARALTHHQCCVLHNFPAEAVASPNAKKQDPGVVAAVEQFNRVSMWAATEVVKGSTCKRRAAAIVHLIQVAHECRKLRNFATTMQVVAGLSISSVIRLRKTWRLVPKKFTARLSALQAELEPLANFRAYRAAVAGAQLPALPYMGLYIRDATFVEDGNDDRLANGMANLEKVRMLGALVREVRYFQLSSYASKGSAAAVAYVARLPSERSEDALYALSRHCEPLASITN